MPNKKAKSEPKIGKIDSDRIVEEVMAEQKERQKLSFYLDKQLYENFKVACGDAVISKVLERLMSGFVESRTTVSKRRRK